VVVGEGPERGLLSRMAAARRLDLRLPGSLPPEAVAEWMAAADLYVQPSRVLPGGRREGTPLAIREALSSGLPVIASNAGGISELDATSLHLVRPDDPAALAAALASGLDAAAVREARRARAHSVTQWKQC
jgi:alpha-1,3-rhamnosyl/mannosyltransferase